MEIQQLRARISAIDEQLVGLFAARMEVSGQVAEYKRAHDLPVFDAEREKAVLLRVSALAGEEFAPYAETLYGTILELSKEYQRRALGRED